MPAIKNAAREMTVNLFTDVFNANDAVQFADASWAILQIVDGQEVWTEVTIKSKAWTPTKRSEAFDPYVEMTAWQEEKAMKAKEKEEKEAEKKRKIAAQKKKEAEG